jgi:hypothetical protein
MNKRKDGLKRQKKLKQIKRKYNNIFSTDENMK